MVPPPPPGAHFRPAYQRGAAPVVGLVPLARRAAVAIAAIVLVIVATLLSMVATWDERNLFIDVRDGVSVSSDRLATVDDFTVVTAWMSVATLAVSGITFIVWFHRAYKNLALWGRTDFRTPWAVLAWFVPILNLWRPFQITIELAAAGRGPRRDRRPPRIVNWWWALWIISLLVTQAVATYEPKTLDGWILLDVFSLVSDALIVIGGLACISVIRYITRLQAERIHLERLERPDQA